MLRREAWQRREALVALRVVLHRARAERIEVRVDRHVECRQIRVVANHVKLGEFGQGGRSVVLERDGDQVVETFGRDVRIRENIGLSPLAALFEQE